MDSQPPTKCPFCRPDEDMQRRVFYDRGNWYALLNVPANADGHTVLVLKKPKNVCPVGLVRQHMRGFDEALSDVVDLLRSHFRQPGGEQPTDVLIASLRALVPHVHWHLIPRWEKQEGLWRAHKRDPLYEKGRLFEYLGDLDAQGQQDAAMERTRRNETEAEQRARMTNALRTSIGALRALSGYQP